MPSRKALTRYRQLAYVRQQGRCYYCDLPVWTADLREFCTRFNISKRLARGRQCTAEHLVARQQGGRDEPANIVAACRMCNTRRHRAKQALSPARYREYVRRRIQQGRWLPAGVRRNSLEMAPRQPSSAAKGHAVGLAGDSGA